MTVDIERCGEKIELRGWIGGQTPALCKSVPNARWNPDGKFWSYPLDTATCRLLREAFGDALRVGVELASWYKSASGAEAALAAVAASTSADLVNVPRYAPRIAKAMASRTYQQTAAAYGALADSFGIFDQPGLGKTIMALGAIVEREPSGGVHLVLCPKVAVETVWAAEINQWLGDYGKAYPLTGDRARREETLEAAMLPEPGVHTFVIGNIEMARIVPWFDTEKDPVLRKPKFKIARDSYMRPATAKRPAKVVETGAEYPELFARQWDTVIVDESHRALVKKPGQPTQQRGGMVELSKRSRRRIALSGTPMRGKPENLWGTLNWLRPELFTSYWQWVGRYFRLTSNGYSDYIIDGWRPDGEDRLAAELKNVALRRTKAEVLPELPPKSYAGTYLVPGDDDSPHAVWLTMDGPQRLAYDKFDAQAVVKVEGGEIAAVGILAENTRKKQFAGATLAVRGEKVEPRLPSVKFDWLLGKLDELGVLENEGDGKIVVASQFTSLLNLFAKELRKQGVALHLLTGETPDGARRDMVRNFQETDDVRVFLLNTHAGGVAVTLDRADDLVLLDETYIPDDQEQVEDRVHRTSRMHNVTIHKLAVLDTIEEEIAWVTAAREDVTRYLLDGARGVEAARQLYAAKAAA